MDITSSQAVADQYAQSISNALGAFTESVSAQAPEGDNAAFILGNAAATENLSSSSSSFRDAGSSFAEGLSSAAAALAEKDSSLAQSI